MEDSRSIVILQPRSVFRLLLLLLTSCSAVLPSLAQLQITHKQGSTHGFLLLKSADGKVIAVGDQIAFARGSLVRSRLVFHFFDGSLDDESTVFEQGSTFRLISDHHIQRGPAFPHAMDINFSVASGTITTCEEKNGKKEMETEHVDLPTNLANGFVSAIIENLRPGTERMDISYLTGTPKPRVVKLSITPDGTDNFRVQGMKHRASRYNIHVELGGLSGLVAPILGKQPSDYTVWMMTGTVPTFLRLQGAFYLQGPIWTMELTSPTWTTSAH